MARIIQFHTPDNYRPKAQAVATTTRGKVIEFPSTPTKQSA